MKTALAIILCLANSQPANAIGPCDVRASVVKSLTEKFEESTKVTGIAGKNFMEIYSSKAGTWTFVITTPEGVSCIIAAGTGYEALPAVADIVKGKDT